MRIIAGTWKKRKLARPPVGVRPTSDRLREAIFSHLGAGVMDSLWLDVFAGSGAIGLEALSRGAKWVHFNERNRAAQGLLQKNVEICNPESGYTLSHQDAFAFLGRRWSEKIDFIYLDPPYQEGLEDRLLATIQSTPVLGQSMIFLEHFKQVELELGPEWDLLQTLKAGDSRVEVLRKTDEMQAQGR